MLWPLASCRGCSIDGDYATGSCMNPMFRRSITDGIRRRRIEPKETLLHLSRLREPLELIFVTVCLLPRKRNERRRKASVDPTFLVLI